ncbi:MAG: BlaI/MecI/CopY family transcriptional regulator [Ignavibacteria bacterium]|jgi:predicted transcriptional regulator
MSKALPETLSRRERQIMDIIYRLKEASVSDILKYLPDPPAYNSIRVILTILEDKGHLLHRKEGQRYIYFPKRSPDKIKKSALTHLVKTFFDGSTSKVVTTLLDMSAGKLSETELDELSKLIEETRKSKKNE